MSIRKSITKFNKFFPLHTQAHGYFCEGETQTISFPFDEQYIKEDSGTCSYSIILNFLLKFSA